MIIIISIYCVLWASQVALVVKNLPANARDIGDIVGRIPWRRAWQPTAVSLSGKSHGQRSLVGYSPWDRTVGHDLVITQPTNIE